MNKETENEKKIVAIKSKIVESEWGKEKEREIQRNIDRMSVCLLVLKHLAEQHFIDRAQNQIHQLLCRRILSSLADSCAGPLPVDPMPELQIVGQ